MLRSCTLQEPVAGGKKSKPSLREVEMRSETGSPAIEHKKFESL